MQQIEDLIGHPETRLGEMIEASPSCLKIVDRSGRLLTMNSKGLSMIEADSMEEVAGADVFALVAPDSREAFIKFHEEVCGGQTKRLIFNLVGLKGTQRTMDTWAAPYRLNNGEVAHLAITNDITEQQQTAAELETQRHALELSARRAALGELAAGIAHEINNPLGIIAGIAGLARAQLAIDKVDKEELSKRLGEIEDTVARISDITGALRTFSRDVPGDQREAYCLRSAVDETFGLVAERCRVHGIRLLNEVPEELSVLINRVQFGQVLMNLLSNSLHAVTELDERWIQVSAETRDDGIHLAFVDSGSGIDAEIVDHIMTPFFSTKPTGEGTGLGLSISHGIMRNLGGALSYHPGRHNTTFDIKLAYAP